MQKKKRRLRVPRDVGFEREVLYLRDIQQVGEVAQHDPPLHLGNLNHLGRCDHHLVWVYRFFVFLFFVYGVGVRVQCLWFGSKGLRFRVHGLWSMVYGL